MYFVITLTGAKPYSWTLYREASRDKDAEIGWEGVTGIEGRPQEEVDSAGLNRMANIKLHGASNEDVCKNKTGLMF